ncbi:unnamed protein product [Lasius platythorax]|uniref:Uncharacterized protein n=1 Tax=Lasius platythorax TaxID=488582 RepID=A0AAV2MY67_9HYME
MSEIPQDQIVKLHPTYYLPHHAVTKESSTTTKVKVVFDGLCKTSTGLSINHVQHIGPRIQDELFYHLIRFR